MSNNLNSFNYASILGVFVGGFLVYLSLSPLLINLFELIKAAFIFYAVWFVIPIKWYQKLIKISKWEVVLFLIFVMAPCSISIFFAINRWVPNNQTIHKYEIKSLEYYGYYGKTNNMAAVQQVRVSLKGDSLASFPDLRTFDFSEVSDKFELSDTFYLTKKEGYFNFPLVIEKGLK